MSENVEGDYYTGFVNNNKISECIAHSQYHKI